MKNIIRIDDIYRLKLVGDPQISPVGDCTCLTVETMHKADKKYYSTLYLVNNANGKGRYLTQGKKSDRCPRWSPDGKRLTFVRKEDMADQVWILPLDGGEAAPLTKLKRGSVEDIVWSPDGKKLALLFHPLGKEQKVKDDGSIETPAYRHITRLWFRLDGHGFFDSEYTHIWVADSKSGTARQIVDGAFTDSFPVWSEKSDAIFFISNRSDDWEYKPEEQFLYRVSLKNQEVQTIAAAPAGPKEGLSLSADGNTLAYLGHREPHHSWGAVNFELNLIDVNGQNHRTFGDNLDRTAYPLTIGDVTPSFVMLSPIWARDSGAVFYMIASEGRQLLMKADLSSQQVIRISRPDDVVVNCSMNVDRTRLVFQNASLGSPDEIVFMDMEKGTARQVTYLNRSFLNSREFISPEEIWFTNGAQKLHGWLVRPPAFDPREKYPLILNVHGGPRCQYGRTFFHEMLALAARGYVGLYTNPRGSQGYGRDFADAITGVWAEPAMSDLMAAVDHVIAKGFVDERRLGVTGGSYGGYMTNWIVTHSDRFAAAVTQRSVSDLASMFGNSDVGWDMDSEFGGPPWEKRDVYQKWSPITYIDKCNTPLLVIHSENDLRCNIEQGDQMYLNLKYLKRDVEYVRFPDEFHGLSRHGRPDRRVERLRFIAEWFDKYLK